MRVAGEKQPGIMLRSLRRQRRLSQAELGRRCQVSAQQICDMEAGRRGPSSGLLERLAATLAVPPLPFYLAFGVVPDALRRAAVRDPDLISKSLSEVL